MDGNVNDVEAFTPPDISEIAKEISLDLLPRKSKIIYEKKYEEFMVWCMGKGVKKVSEDVLLSYFSLKAKVMKSPSLWSLFSMIKATLKVKHDIDIKGFHKLMAFLKLQSVGYKPQKSKTFSEENIRTFLLQAPNVDFLMKKVVLIFGIAGACRRDELVKMTTDDIEDKTNVLIVTVPDSKTNKGRVFIITNDKNINPTLDYLAICKQYFMLRPNKTTTNRLFLNYKKGVCTNQVVGMNTIAKIPCDIANYLGLPEPSQYTGHCFRRTSAALLRKRKKEYGSPTNDSARPGCKQDNSSSSLPSVLTSEHCASAQERTLNEAFKNEVFKEEFVLEDYGDPDEPMEYPVPEGMGENGDIAGNKGMVSASVFSSGGITAPFEYVMCGSSEVKIKQEALEIESDSLSSHGVDPSTGVSLPVPATVEETAERVSPGVPQASPSSDPQNLLSRMTTKVRSLLNKSQKQIEDENRLENSMAEVPAVRLEKCQICVNEVFTSRSDLVQHCILKHSDGSSRFSTDVKPSGEAIDKLSSQNSSILGELDTPDPLVLCETTLAGRGPDTTLSSYNLATMPSYNSATSARYRAAMTPGYRAATTPGYRAATTPGYRASTAPGYRAAITPGYSAATTPGFRAAITPGYRAATTAGHSAVITDTTTTPSSSIGCDICEEISAIIPEESRKATITKILELVKLISDENINPELVTFSVIRK